MIIILGPASAEVPIVVDTGNMGSETLIALWGVLVTVCNDLEEMIRPSGDNVPPLIAAELQTAYQMRNQLYNQIAMVNGL